MRSQGRHAVNGLIYRGSDPSLRDLVERILPLATYYTAISSFIELRSHLDFGLVNHALCASMRDMLKVSLFTWLSPKWTWYCVSVQRMVWKQCAVISGRRSRFGSNNGCVSETIQNLTRVKQLCPFLECG